jgi:adenylylsulfate kinase-like enzyme
MRSGRFSEMMLIIRWQVAVSYFSKFLADQEIHVVAAVLSIFPEWRRWNRQNIPDYVEVYIKASMQTLLRRETKSIYAKALKGEITNVVGVDLPFPEPEDPDLIIDNDTDVGDFREVAGRILAIDVVRRALVRA